MIQLFDIKTRTLGFAFCQPPKSPYQNLSPKKKSLQNFKPKKSPQIANFKPKKGLRTSPSLIYLSTPPGPRPFLLHIKPTVESNSVNGNLVPRVSLSCPPCLALGGQERETLGTRLSKWTLYTAQKHHKRVY